MLRGVVKVVGIETAECLQCSAAPMIASFRPDVLRSCAARIQSIF